MQPEVTNGDAVTGSAYRRLLDALPEALLIADAEGAIRFANEMTERLFGYSPAQLCGTLVDELLPAQALLRREHTPSALSAYLRLEGTTTGLPAVGLHADGRELALELRLSPLSSKAGRFTLIAAHETGERARAQLDGRRLAYSAGYGNVLGASVHALDENAERAVEDQKRAATQHLLTAIESIQGMFALFDAERRLVLCNSQFRRFLGTACTGQLIGRHFDELIESALSARLLGDGPVEDLRLRLTHLRDEPGASLVLRTGETRTVRWAERSTSEGGTVITIWDITEQVARAEKLEKLHRAAEAACSAKRAFLASMSHELRTPLNAILGFGQLLLRDQRAPLAACQRGRVAEVVRSGERLLHLLEEVLEQAGIDSGGVLVAAPAERTAASDEKET